MNKIEKKKKEQRLRNKYRCDHRKDDPRFVQLEDGSWRFARNDDFEDYDGDNPEGMWEGDLRSRTKTRQSDKDAADINNICKNLTNSDILTMAEVGRRLSVGSDVVDFTSDIVTDFQTMMFTCGHMQNQFNELGRAVQERFKSPDALAAWLADPANKEEAIELGFYKEPLPEPAPEPAPEAPEPAPEPEPGPDQTGPEL